MSATDLLADEFDDDVRQRGENDFSRGMVEIGRMSPTRVTARAYGKSVYTVTLSYSEEDDLQWYCTCRYDWGSCKHIWATLLAAEARGWQPLAAFTDDDRPVQTKSRSAGAKFLSPANRPKPAKAAADRWKTELQRIKNRMSQVSSPQMLSQPSAPPPWSSQREVCYVLDVGAMLTHQEGILIEVMARSRRKTESPQDGKRTIPTACFGPMRRRTTA